jgi:hypothetical protein
MRFRVSYRTLAAAWLAKLAIVLAVAPRIDAHELLTAATNAVQRFFPDDPIWRDADTRDIKPVAKFDLSKSYEFVNETFGGSAKSFGPALNVNTLGEVPDSSWFTNRIGREEMDLEAVLRGPNQVDGPAPGMWHVTGRPDSGITPKFTIRDARGDVYILKLDPARNAELPSSVELISTKIFHAIGYHVPEDFIVSFDLARLDVAKGAMIRTDSGDRRPIAMQDVEQWLRYTPRTADGRIRALASRYVPGKVVGQFRYTGTRSDDPNDIFPHERRRELRGLRVFAAWLNHDDARSLNSIDSYVEENGRRYIRHYLQDFGSNLGSGSTSAQQPRGGNEYLIEGDKILKGLFSFGLYTRDWAKVRYSSSPALGNIEADYFQPAKWKTEYPQPAFDQMDAADAFWAANITSRFTNLMIRAVVEEGRLSDPADARQLADIIIRRRDKVVAYWIAQTNPLDRFEVESSGGAQVLTFDNAAIRVRVAQPGDTYAAHWSALDNRTGIARSVDADRISAEPRIAIPAAAYGPPDQFGSRYARVAIETTHAGFPAWRSPVIVTIRDRDGNISVVGIERPTGKQ